MTRACAVCSIGSEKVWQHLVGEKSGEEEKLRFGGDGPGFVVDVNVGHS